MKFQGGLCCQESDTRYKIPGWVWLLRISYMNSLHLPPIITSLHKKLNHLFHKWYAHIIASKSTPGPLPWEFCTGNKIISISSLAQFFLLYIMISKKAQMASWRPESSPHTCATTLPSKHLPGCRLIWKEHGKINPHQRKKKHPQKADQCKTAIGKEGKEKFAKNTKSTTPKKGSALATDRINPPKRPTVCAAKK